MKNLEANVVICGAGIAGVAAAYFLTVRRGVENVILVDERPPLTLTSDKSTEAYRNWWPGPDDAMIRLMNRSIDLLDELADESGNRFLLNRRGYVYATAVSSHIPILKQRALQGEAQGAGPSRFHTGAPDDPIYQPAAEEAYKNQPDGCDLLLDQALIRHHFPYLSEETVALMHIRRCGWFSGQQLGMYMLEQAQANGVQFISGRVEDVEVVNGRVHTIHITKNESEKGQDGKLAIKCNKFVNAAGPYVADVAAMLDIDLPVFSERHLKVSMNDTLGIVPRDAPLLIWEDKQYLPWSPEEREFLAESEETAWLLGEFPEAVHGRPEGGGSSPNLLMLWPFDAKSVPVTFPIADEPDLPEIVLRGMTTMLPALEAYFDRLPKSYIDGGYYTKTRENRLLSCPLPVTGSYLIGTLSGFGLMSACGAADLLAAHITESDLPAYAPAFSLDRYDDPAYQKLLEDWGSSGQL